MTFDQRKQLLNALQALEDGRVNLPDTAERICRIFPAEIPCNVIDNREGTFSEASLMPREDYEEGLTVSRQAFAVG